MAMDPNGGDTIAGKVAIGATGSTAITGFKLDVRPVEFEALAVQVLVRLVGFERLEVPVDQVEIDELALGEESADSVGDARTAAVPGLSLKVIEDGRRGLLENRVRPEPGALPLLMTADPPGFLNLMVELPSFE